MIPPLVTAFIHFHLSCSLPITIYILLFLALFFSPLPLYSTTVVTSCIQFHFISLALYPPPPPHHSSLPFSFCHYPCFPRRVSLTQSLLLEVKHSCILNFIRKAAHVHVGKLGPVHMHIFVARAHIIARNWTRRKTSGTSIYKNHERGCRNSELVKI